MSKTLALLSGKGGSGKTTLGLSIASMLADCEIKVLLIDCDLSTNGATYFYESRLMEHGERTDSFYKNISGLNDEKDRLIAINKDMYFMPSITRITKENTETYTYVKNDGCFLQNFEKRYVNKFDVIIFDCQAGYTDVLKLILPIVDINLVVMEADAISGAAIRSLYLKVGDILNEKKIYQVFNKASEEEYEIYSKVSGGLTFTNIETVKFDWKIRKAFSVAEIPDMKKTSADYGAQIYNICRILFKEKYIQTKLDKYGIVIELNSNSEQERRLEESIKSLQRKKIISKSKISRLLLTAATGAMAVLTCYVFFIMVDSKIFSNQVFSGPLIGLLAAMAVSCVSFFIGILDSSKESRSIDRKVYTYKKQLGICQEDKQKLQKRYRELDRNEDI